ncbi:MAG: GerW family sporulation protein [Roseburia sp.]
MADNSFNSTVESLFKGMDSFMTTKTVVGDAIHIGDTIILPLVDVSFGVAAGAFSQDKKNNGAGGMGGKIMPSAVLVIQDGSTKLVNIKNQDGITKILDMVPDFVNKFTSKNKEVDDASENVVDDASNHVEPKEAEAKTAAEKELEEFLKKSVDANE